MCGRSRASSLNSSSPERVSIWPSVAIRSPPSQIKKLPHQSGGETAGGNKGQSRAVLLDEAVSTRRPSGLKTALQTGRYGLGKWPVSARSAPKARQVLQLPIAHQTSRNESHTQRYETAYGNLAYAVFVHEVSRDISFRANEARRTDCSWLSAQRCREKFGLASPGLSTCRDRHCPTSALDPASSEISVLSGLIRIVRDWLSDSCRCGSKTDDSQCLQDWLDRLSNRLV
jgi:hypothetical protein